MTDVGQVARPTLTLLDGPPASGKSTLASMWSEWESGPVAVDIDEIRHGVPSWPSDPMAAGLEARRRALDHIEELLRAGHDVIVPQFLLRPDFIEALAATARRARARFVECALTIERSVVIDSFIARAAAPARPRTSTRTFSSTTMRSNATSVTCTTHSLRSS